MEARMELQKASPNVRKVYEAMLGLEKAIASGALETSLLDLVRMRASQINGCAYCLDMHSKELRDAGETEQRLYCLDAWRETPFYTPRECAALALTEAVTLINKGHVPDEVYEQARQEFTEEEVALLTAAIAAINVWNRLNITFRTVPGNYHPGQFRVAGHEPVASAH